MSRRIALAVLAVTLASVPTLADTYPVSGRWGESASTEKGAIECHGRRVIAFNGDQRTDNKGGVPAFRNVSVRKFDSGYRITDVFTTGQISNANTTFTLRQTDADHIEIRFEPSGQILKLQRCK
ncbi:MAG: hypothetical protein AB7O50_11340 [Pseudolabrys sp.]